MGQGNRNSLRLAYFSPLPPARSGIADYSRELLPYLAERCSLTLFVDSPQDVSPSLRVQYDVRPLAAYAQQRWQYEAALYQMGNSVYHDGLYRIMRRFPGIVVLHDYVLHHFLAHRSAVQGDSAAYTRELAYELGRAGVDRAWALRFDAAEHVLEEHPLNRRVVDLNLGALVHSEYVRVRLASRTQRPVLAVPALVTPSPARSRREQLPWSEDALIFASFGQMTQAKRLDHALRAFARLRAEVPAARYLLVGESLADFDLEALLHSLGLADTVFVAGYAPGLQSFLDWLVTADVVVNLRHPTLGETSATALRALAASRPLVVYDHGWYSELPDAVAVKVPPLDEEALLVAMDDLARDAAKREELARAARSYATRSHHPEKTARAYVRAIGHILDEVAGYRGDA